VLRRFERLWPRERPAIDDFLAACPAGERLAVLGELAHTDLEFRLRAGEPARVEDYLGRYPELADRPAIVAGLLAAEFHLRCQCDPACDPADFRRRFPQHAGLLERLAQENAALATVNRLSSRLGPEPPGAPPGVDVPGYEILGELGRGGMGVVYKARQTAANRLVALKMILAGAHAGADDLARFRTEAQAIARLQHPHVVQIHEVGEHDGLPFFSLEFCPRGSLSKKLGGTPLPPREAAALVEKLAHGMHAAHQKGVIHRDLKPANVLLGEDGTPKITDFGLAKKLDEAGQTASGAIMGTPSYMAPEQAGGKSREIGSATDVYALGAILYECLTGRPPFKAATALDTILQVMADDPVPPSQLNARTPRDLEIICLKCLRKEPGKRYGSALALAEDLHRFLGGEPIQARRVSAGERGLKWARRRPAQAALAAALLVAAAATAAGTVYYVRYEHARAEAAQRQYERLQNIDRYWEEGKEAEASGQMALGRGDEEEAVRQFREAEERWNRALAGLDQDTDAPDGGRRQEIADAHARVRGHLGERSARQQFAVHCNAFYEERDKILSHETDHLVRDRAANAEEVRRLALAALGRFNLGPKTPPDQARGFLEPYRGWLGPKQARRLAEGCYEVLLTWAEAEAAAPPGPAAADPKDRAARALTLLAVAEGLGEGNGVPTPRAFHARRSRYLAQAGKDREAAAERDRASRVRPDTALDDFLAALDLYRAQQFADAARACAQALEKESDHLGALYLQAICRFQTGHWAEAQLGLTLYLGRKPDSFAARLLRGTACGFQNQTEAAEIDFGQALAEAQKAEDALGQAIVLNNRGFLRLREAIKELATQAGNAWCLGARGPCGSSTAAGPAPHLLATAGWASAARRGTPWLEGAREDLEKAITVWPQAYQAYANLAQVHVVRKDYRAAEQVLTRALDRRPRDAGLYRTRARTRLGLGDQAGARDDFHKAIQMRPKGDHSEELASDCVELGHLYHRAEKYPEALAAFDAAFGVVADYPLAHRLRAETLLRQKRDAEAGLALELYLKKGGRPTAEVYKTLGLIHTSLRRNPEALAAFSEALRLRAEDAEALRFRGWTYLRLDVPRAALADFEAALKQEGNHADALCGRGHALVLLDRVPEAVRDADAVFRAAGTPPRLMLYTACIYARAAAKIAAGPYGRSPANQQLIDRHERRAASVLFAALMQVPASERGNFWRKNVQNEPALAPIRHNAVMRELEERYGR
jgi:regulator of sirC expression with transglutaminase-like and TPR domain